MTTAKQTVLSVNGWVEIHHHGEMCLVGEVEFGHQADGETFHTHGLVELRWDEDEVEVRTVYDGWHPVGVTHEDVMAALEEAKDGLLDDLRYFAEDGA